MTHKFKDIEFDSINCPLCGESGFLDNDIFPECEGKGHV